MKKRKSPEHISNAEILAMLREGENANQIAARLGRKPSFVYHRIRKMQFDGFGQVELARAEGRKKRKGRAVERV
jgi:transposase